MAVMEKEIEKLIEITRKMRVDIINMTTQAGSGHPGPAFSIVEILAALYFHEMKIDPKRSKWMKRDRIVLSKGHAAPALYAALYERGFFSEETLLNLRKMDYPLQGHPSAKTVGVDATSGSLGTGLSQAVGMALGARMHQMPVRVYCIIGDGECDEGQIWEAALSAAHFKINNLIVFLDKNNDQFEGRTCQVLNLEPLKDKWEAFGWRVREINGHKFEDIINFLDESHSIVNQPSIAIANTYKGYGVSFMQGNHDYHARALNPDEVISALHELETNYLKAD